MFIWKILQRILFLLDPEWVHELGTFFLRVRGFFLATNKNPVRIIAKKFPELAGFTLDSPLGIAAGFDKDAKLILGLRSLGFGFVEVGTVTPLPQPGNPKPRLFRLPENKALINRMGFNSEGAHAVAERMRDLRIMHTLNFPVGINLGKNRETPLEKAGDDYVKGIQILYDVADYLVINLSSPNTPGLTGLQEGDLLAPLLKQVREARDDLAKKMPGSIRPLFLKLSPDLSFTARQIAVQCAVDYGFGIIASNTSRRRDFSGLVDCKELKEEGGLSGPPLKHDALQHLKEIRSIVGPKPIIISVGGISTANDARDRLEAGANLLQAYTGFIYGGPSFARQIAKGISLS